MGLFDKIGKVLFGEKMPEKPVMKITMMGARGVGKTSVLTSMYSNMNEAINDTGLYITADPGTDLILKNKSDDLKRMFYYGNDINDEVKPGIAGDSTVSKYSFEFGLSTEKVAINLELQDFPGEYVRDEPETVKQYIEESNCVLIAIDTPHLMECDGRYNDGKNYTSVITNFFKETLNAQSSEKLIMLVPLKCEKYYHDMNIDQVTAKVRSTYRELISFLKDKDNENGFQGRFACVIAPIQTVGEIVFDGFAETDGQVEEIMLKNVPVPKKVKYKYLKADAAFNPKHCEQPLYYLLSFVAKQYLRMKENAENSGLLGRFMKLWAQTPQVSNLLVELQRFSFKKLDKADGFVVCCGNGKV